MQELVEIRNAADRELQTHLESLNALRVVGRRLEEAKVLVRNIAEKGGQPEVLVPLSSNLFIPGRLETADGFLVDVGAGYYARLDAEATLRNADMDSGYAQQAMEAQSEALNAKQRMREQVQLQIKLREMREATNRVGS